MPNSPVYLLQFRLVVKTALKLLVVFVEYTESNSLLLLAAVYIVDKERAILPWSNIMNVIAEKDTSDLELFLYAMTLINKVERVREKERGKTFMFIISY